MPTRILAIYGRTTGYLDDFTLGKGAMNGNNSLGLTFWLPVIEFLSEMRRFKYECKFSNVGNPKAVKRRYFKIF